MSPYDELGLEAPAKGLRFYSPAELADLTVPEPDWFIRPGLLARGAITEIDGKIKAAGKTTLALWMIRALLDGTPFLGEPTIRSKVIYVTEQSRQTFMDALRRAGLGERSDELSILFREDIGKAPWPEVTTAAQQDGYDVAVFDTIGKLAGIKEENSAGEWAAAMAPLQDLAASGRAVLVLRHDRKGGGEVGESGRGSSQASGDVDIILALRRPEGHQPATRRVLESLSRYPETPDKVVIELRDDGYLLLGSDEAVQAATARECLSAALRREFRQTGSGLTMKALEDEGKAVKVARSTLQAELDKMIAAGEVERTGRGVAGHPFVYAVRTHPPADSGGAESAETQSYTGRPTLPPVTRRGLTVSEEMEMIFGEPAA